MNSAAAFPNSGGLLNVAGADEINLTSFFNSLYDKYLSRQSGKLCSICCFNLFPNFIIAQTLDDEISNLRKIKNRGKCVCECVCGNLVGILFGGERIFREHMLGVMKWRLEKRTFQLLTIPHILSTCNNLLH